MIENQNQGNMRLSDQLPSHSPDPGLWDSLSSRLDALDVEVLFQQKIEQLPIHSPDHGTWAIINSRLNRIAYFKTGMRIAMAAAAGFLLFITVTQISDSKQITTHQLAIKESQIDPVNIPKHDATIAEVADNQEPIKTIHLAKVFASKDNPKTDKNKESIVSSAKKEIVQPINNLGANIATETKNIYPANNEIQPIPTPVAAFQEKNATTPELAETNLATLIEQPVSKTAKPLKYYSPDDPKPSGSKNHFALAMDYLPENIDNGSDISLFHNVGLTASYNKEKVRFNTSLGMAYNEQQLEFDMNYDVQTPVTAVGPGGTLDTLRYELANMDAQYQGTEKHKYFTYNLGFGRRILNWGKFSSWINAGAGFGVRLNNPDLIAATENNIKGQFNAKINSIETSKPVYNTMNLNLVTGIDFNYQILNKLSITFTPTSRWYFKPVLSKNNQPTDELTLGFKTGIKLDL